MTSAPPDSDADLCDGTGHGVTHPPRRRRTAVPLLALIRGYQYLMAGRPSPCRFDPSCSTYAIEALSAHGVARGLLLSIRRLARCHPWGGQGYDPVPPVRGTS